MARKKRRGPGEGTIYQKQDGYWVAAVTIGYNEKGNPKRKTFTGKTQREARQKLEKYQAETFGQARKDPEKMTFGNWLDIWLENYAGPTVRPGTYERYESNIRLHLKPDLGKILLPKLEGFHLQELYTKKQGELSPRSIRYVHTTARAALEQALDDGLIYRNPADRRSGKKRKLPPLPAKKITTYSPDDIKTFLDVAKKRSRYYTAFLLAVSTGLRRGEILGLKWKDIDFTRNRLTVSRSLTRSSQGYQFQEPKSKLANRTIELPEFVINALREHQKAQKEEKMKFRPIYKESDLVFTREEGSPVNPNSLTVRFKQIAKELEEKGHPKITLHGLRHTYASLALEAGTPVKTVQENLGHHSPAFTLSIYAHASDQSKKESAKKFNDLLSKL